MSKMLVHCLPYPPSANRYWRIFRGRPVTSSEARLYKANAKVSLSARCFEPLSGPLSLFVGVYRPARRGDLDNTLKVVLDACNGFLWNDDSQIVDIFASRYEDKENPRVELAVVGGEV